MIKPKIMFYLFNLTGGGAERQMLNMVRHIGKDFEAILYIKNFYGPIDIIQTENIKVISFEKGKTRNSGIYSLYKQVIHVRNTILDESVDIVYARLFNTFLRIYILLKLFNIKFIFIACEASNPKLEFANLSLIEKWFGLKTYIYKKSLNRADEIICLNCASKLAVAELCHKKLENIHVIPIGLDFDMIDSYIRLSDYDASLFSQDTFTFISVGRLHFVKGHRNLLIAFNRLIYSIKKNSVQLLILGEGPDYFNLIDLANKLQLSFHVKFLGFKKNPYIYMKNSNVFVFTSLFEGFGNALLEAIYCGLPVITTDCKGGPQELRSKLGEFAQFVPINDPDTLSLSMARVMDRFEYYKERSFLISKSLRNKYSIEKIVRDTSRLLSRTAMLPTL